MAEEKDIRIKRTIVHILDSNVGLPVISQREHPADDDVDNFLENHIRKILNDNSLKNGRFFDEGSDIKGICENIIYSPGEYCEDTGRVAKKLYEIMLSNPDIPPADLVCCIFEADGVEHLGILKFNYRNSYIHYVGGSAEGTLNTIIKQKTSLPGDGQKVDECALINLRDFSIKLLEKKYEINGEKQPYFSEIFMKCSCNPSLMEKVKKFKKANDSFSKKILQGDMQNSGNLRAAISESIRENDAIDVDDVAQNAFNRNPDMKETYMDFMEKAGVERAIKISGETLEKTFKIHRIKTDTGVEINLPAEYFKDSGKIEFVSNPDGTISIVIKNVSSITDI